MVIRVQELDKSSTYKNIGFVQYYAENTKDQFWSLEEVFQNGLLIKFKVKIPLN